jgi:hypothetical protein
MSTRWPEIGCCAFLALRGDRMKALVIATDNDNYRNLEKQRLVAFRLRADSFLQFPDVCDFAMNRFI